MFRSLTWRGFLLPQVSIAKAISEIKNNISFFLDSQLIAGYGD
jgi:hypothetical protein